MKKIIISVLVLSMFLLTGCTKYTEKTIKQDLKKNMKGIKGYHLLGELEVYNGDNTYKYKVETSNDKDKYRVCLVNKSNNHEQIILKNDDGVYVLTTLKY